MFSTLDPSRFHRLFLERVMVKEPLIKANENLLNAAKLSINTKFNVKKSAVLCIGGFKRSGVSEVHKTKNAEQKKYLDLPSIITYHYSLKHDDYLYFIGGAINGNWSNKTTDKVY